MTQDQSDAQKKSTKKTPPKDYEPNPNLGGYHENAEGSKK